MIADNFNIDFLPTPKSILNESYCVLIGINSDTVFLFWKFSNYIISSFESSVFDEKILIRIFDVNNKIVTEIDANYLDSRIYIIIPQANFPIYAKIYVRDKENITEVSRSNEVVLSYEKELTKEYDYLNENI